jgi:hypothetical protein
VITLKFIKPKNQKRRNSDWELTERTLSIVKYYSEYTGYTEEDVLEQFLQNILSDKEFANWIYNKRNNKRILKDLELSPGDKLQTPSSA